MNEVTIFTGITTEQALQQIEADSKKYNEGLWADMNNPDERRIIKSDASVISDIRKKLERARIDIKKAHGLAVDNEAKSIDERLAKANEPYDVLINKYNAERKVILDAENARKKAIEDQAAIDSDYEIAELLMEKYFNDKAKAESERIAYEENLKREAIEQAVKVANQCAINAEVRRLADIEQVKQDEINRQQREQQALANEQARREDDTEHKRQVNNEILADLTDSGIDDNSAKKMIALIVKGLVRNIKITY